MTVCQIKDISLPAPRRKPLKCQICEKLPVNLKKKSSIKTQLFGQETDDLVCDCNHDTDQYSDARSKLEPT